MARAGATRTPPRPAGRGRLSACDLLTARLRGSAGISNDLSCTRRGRMAGAAEGEGSPTGGLAPPAPPGERASPAGGSATASAGPDAFGTAAAGRGAGEASDAGAGAGSATGAGVGGSASGGTTGTGSPGGAGTGGGTASRAGRSTSGSRYPCGSDVTLTPRWTYGSTCSASPLGPIVPTAVPSGTRAPRATAIVPRWTSVTE
jgi:hypothetical protein